MRTPTNEMVDQPVTIVPTGAELFDGPDTPVVLLPRVRAGRKPAGSADQGYRHDG